MEATGYTNDTVATTAAKQVCLFIARTGKPTKKNQSSTTTTTTTTNNNNNNNNRILVWSHKNEVCMSCDLR